MLQREVHLQHAVQSRFRPRFLTGAVFLSTPFGFLTAGDAESPVLCWASALLLLTALAPPEAVRGMGLQQHTAIISQTAAT